MPPMPPADPQQGAGGGPSTNLGLDFLVGLLAGAGLPVISRALRPGRTPGERMATGGAMNPRSMLDEVTSAMKSPSPLGQPSLQDILPALAAKSGPGLSGMQIPPSMLAMLQPQGGGMQPPGM